MLHDQDDSAEGLLGALTKDLPVDKTLQGQGREHLEAYVRADMGALPANTVFSRCQLISTFVPCTPSCSRTPLPSRRVAIGAVRHSSLRCVGDAARIHGLHPLLRHTASLRAAWKRSSPRAPTLPRRSAGRGRGGAAAVPGFPAAMRYDHNNPPRQRAPAATRGPDGARRRQREGSPPVQPAGALRREVYSSGGREKEEEWDGEEAARSGATLSHRDLIRRETVFARQMRDAHGWTIEPMAGDGACLFRAIGTLPSSADVCH